MTSALRSQSRLKTPGTMRMQKETKCIFSVHIWVKSQNFLKQNCFCLLQHEGKCSVVYAHTVEHKSCFNAMLSLCVLSTFISEQEWVKITNTIYVKVPLQCQIFKAFLVTMTKAWWIEDKHMMETGAECPITSVLRKDVCMGRVLICGSFGRQAGSYRMCCLFQGLPPSPAHRPNRHCTERRARSSVSSAAPRLRTAL